MVLGSKRKNREKAKRIVHHIEVWLRSSLPLRKAWEELPECRRKMMRRHWVDMTVMELEDRFSDWSKIELS